MYMIYLFQHLRKYLHFKVNYLLIKNVKHYFVSKQLKV